MTRPDGARRAPGGRRRGTAVATAALAAGALVAGTLVARSAPAQELDARTAAAPAPAPTEAAAGATAGTSSSTTRSGTAAGTSTTSATSRPAAPAARTAAAAAAAAAKPATAPNQLFPRAAVVDVKARYGAKGDGRTDDTRALQRAVRENHGRVLYLPAGTYLVSDTIDGVDAAGKWQPYMMLQGQQRDRVVLKLKAGAPGFGDRARPKPVIRTNSGTFVEQPRPDGIGNEAFANYVESLTIDTGTNRGAVGIDHVVSNYGALRHVHVRGRGVTGVAMTRGLVGPGLVKNVTVTGFDVGIAVDATEYGATFEHLRLSGQRVAGMRGLGGSLAVRGLRSTNTVPALVVAGGTGQVSLVDATLTGGTSRTAAIRLTQGSAGLFARDVSARGYRSVVDDNGRRVGTTSVAEWTSSPVAAPFGGSRRSLELPVRETPTFHDNDLRRWANVEDFGARRDDWVDDSAAIQKAIDSGRTTLYFPTGRYFVGSTVKVRGAIRSILGQSSTVAPIGPGWGDAAKPRAMFSIQDGAPQGVIISKLFVGKLIQADSAAGVVGFRHDSRRPLTLQDGACCAERNQLPVTATAKAGPLFLENYTVAGLRVRPGQKVWARQLNPEGDVKRVVNRGGTVWILGLKMEGGESTLETTSGGCSELLGSTLYVFDKLQSVVPYVTTDSSASVSGVTTAYGATDYRVHVRETRKGVTRTVGRDALSWRGDGRSMPLYTSGSRAGCR